MKMMRKTLGASLALLCAMSAHAADLAPAASAPLPQDGTLVVAGDSITFHAVSLPCGFHHQLTNAFAKVCPEKRLKVASLGFSGYQVGTWLGVESKTRDGKPAAHFEHTVAIRKGKAEILSSFEEIEQIEGKRY